jgi:putative addiction module component (TIGR02574 family)
MTEVAEITKTAMLLPEDERAKLASQLLGSLPAMLHDDDEGLAEARRRDAELDRDPSAGMTMEEFRKAFEQ